ncbi:hypothetical protein [Bradyrhizobium cenepequi]
MALEIITEDFCGWPYFQPYVFTQKKQRAKRSPKKRSGAAKALRSPALRQRVVPNKKRKAKAPKVTLESDA